MDFVVRIYEVTGKYPPDERFGLVAESRETVRSIPYNIAEGKMRSSVNEYRHFVNVAKGSAGELTTQILVAGRLKYIEPATVDSLESEVCEIGRMLRGLERSLS